jgi:Co/Zn/Cd efflux system component
MTDASHDAHGHEHDHKEHAEPGWRGGRKRLLGHSHSGAEQLDAALESSADGIRALKISLAALALTAAAQTGVLIISGSVALLGDTLHNLSDALTAVPLWIAFRLGRRPATNRYTYGYGRAEDLAGAVIVVMIAASAVLVGYQAVDRLLEPRDVEHLAWVAFAGLFGFVCNEIAAQVRIRTGRHIGSAEPRRRTRDGTRSGSCDRSTGSHGWSDGRGGMGQALAATRRCHHRAIRTPAYARGVARSGVHALPRDSRL